MAFHNIVGQWGEKLAQEYLITKGYTLRELNWHVNHYELDIVAEYKGKIVFVEVKTRTTEFLTPDFALNERKQQFLVRAGTSYIKMYNLSLPMQFDAIIIIGTPQQYTLKHLDNFIRPKVKTYHRGYSLRGRTYRKPLAPSRESKEDGEK